MNRREELINEKTTLKRKIDDMLVEYRKIELELFDIDYFENKKKYLKKSEQIFIELATKKREQMEALTRSRPTTQEFELTDEDSDSEDDKSQDTCDDYKLINDLEK